MSAVEVWARENGYFVVSPMGHADADYGRASGAEGANAYMETPFPVVGELDRDVMSLGEAERAAEQRRAALDEEREYRDDPEEYLARGFTDALAHKGPVERAACECLAAMASDITTLSHRVEDLEDANSRLCRRVRELEQQLAVIATMASGGEAANFETALAVGGE